MMRFFDIQLVLYYAIILSSIHKSEEAETETEDDPLEAVESRHRPRHAYQGQYGEREYRRRTTDLPVSFQAPQLESTDYWRYRPQRRRDSHRRTFDDFGYFPYDNKPSFPAMNNFYQLMNHFFRGNDDYQKPNREQYPFDYSKHIHDPYPKPLSDPYPYEFPPYNYRPTEATLLPPPKPVRASVVKLEQITREPDIFPPLDYTTTSKYYPHFVNLLNQVLLENMRKHHDELGFHQPQIPQPHPDPVINFRGKPVLDKPILYNSIHDNIIPTTYKPTSKSKDLKKYYPKYPGSIQDQLPPLKHGEDPKIPYVSATTANQLPTTDYALETTSVIDPRSGATDSILFPTDAPTTGTTYPDIDIRILNLKSANIVATEPTEVASTPATESTTINSFIEYNNTITDNLLGDSTEAYKIIRPPPKKTSRSKKVPVSNSVELITDLTLKGLSKNPNHNVNIPRYVNHVNMSNLINYEIGKLKQNQEYQPSTEQTTEDYKSLTTPRWRHVLDINDELSLDLKILKDTNWDGFTATDLPTTTEVEVTTEKFTPEKKPVVVETRVTKSVSKIVGFSPEFQQELELPILPTTVRPIPEGFNTERNEIQTAAPTEISTSTQTTTTTTTTATELFQKLKPEISTENEIRRRIGVTLTTQNEIERPLRQRMERPNFDEKFDIAAFITTTTPSYPRRKYNRRPKVKSYTQFPAATEKQDVVKFGVISRTSFPKRQKPNITLTFGNRTIKIDDKKTKGEIMKFSDEDLRKSEEKRERRRYQYKKRRRPDYVRQQTTELPTTIVS